MANKPKLGDNRTGTARARERSEEMVSGNLEFAPAAARLDAKAIADVRKGFAEESEPIGSVPPPASLKQVGKTVVGAVKGGSPTLFVDQIGARLAFERNGVRLYEALISKFDAFGSFDGGPTRAELQQILAEEQQHFAMLCDALVELGADPTAMTPSADVEAVLATGVQAVMVDARTDLAQSLQAALIAELADNDAWEGLIDLALKAGEQELAARFKIAVDDERRHLSSVRAWLAAHRQAA